MSILGRFFGVRRMSSKSVAAIPKAEKQLIEDYLEQGWLVVEIADETGYASEQISRIKDIWQRKKKEKRRDNAESASDFGEFDNLARARRDLEAEKVRLQIDNLALQREEIALKREELNQDYDDEQPEQDTKASVGETILLGLAQGFMKGQQQPPPNRVVVPAAIQTVLAPSGQTIIETPSTDRAMSDEQLSNLISTLPSKVIKGIKRGVISKEQAISLALAYAKGINQSDAERAYQMVMGE